MRDSDLRASLLAIGQLQPALEYEGELVDGRRRAAVCSELGKALNVQVCTSLREACSMLWAVDHQLRAIELAQRNDATRVLELAELCGTSGGAVALVLQQQRPKKSPTKRTRAAVNELKSSTRMVRRVVTFEPELLDLAKRKAAEKNKNLASVVRDAVWNFVRDVPGAPRHQPRRVQAQNGARRRTG